MTPDSARVLKAELCEPATGAWRAQVEALPRAGVALGLGPGHGAGDVRLVAYVEDPSLAPPILAAAAGEADVVVLPRAVAQVATAAVMQRAADVLRPGLSVGHPAITAGTLGCLVEVGGRPHVLTNAHVGAPPGARVGDDLLQPGPLDGRALGSSRPVAALADMEQPAPGRANRIDACVCRLLDGVAYVPAWDPGIGTPRAVRDPVVGDLGRTISGMGRTTARERLIVRAVELDGLLVDHGAFTALFAGQIDAVPAPGYGGSRGGDSGSVYMTEDGAAIGHLHAGGQDGAGVAHTFLAPLATTLARFGATLLGVQP